MKKLRICMIDDDQIYQFMAKRIIDSTQLSEELFFFSDGEEAWNYFSANAKVPDFQLPDIIFLDINMPYMDGWQFLEQFATLSPHFPEKVPIFLVSSSVDEADTERAEQNPLLSGYIFKPFSKDKFLEAVRLVFP